MRDKIILYDQIYDPAVTGAIAPGATFDLPTVNAAAHLFIIEEMLIWSPYTIAGLPADLERCQSLIDGQPFPATPGRMEIRAMADRCMAPPYDQRFWVRPEPFGKISLDPLEDTTVKVTPAQTLAVRLCAGLVAGVLATDSRIRVMLRGRIADTDAQLKEIYGGDLYQPGLPMGERLMDPVTGKVSPAIRKSFPLTIDNASKMSGATGQDTPKITPFWTFGVNSAVIPATPEYEWTFVNPPHVARAFEEMSFDWTRIEKRALVIKSLGAFIAAGRGRVWLDQPPLRRPGHMNLFHGWVVDAGFPNLLPGGGAIAGLPMYKEPYELDPRVLAFNNLTQLRVTADPGTTILAGNLEMQMKGTHIEF